MQYLMFLLDKYIEIYPHVKHEKTDHNNTRKIPGYMQEFCVTPLHNFENLFLGLDFPELHYHGFNYTCEFDATYISRFPSPIDFYKEYQSDAHPSGLMFLSH
jgi:hypothetical protein